ncbi:MAG: O-antigen ligase family protein [Lachnospiraceae bacterium]|jgi:O-antigen ligase|nr:O-antigen ligase family protein [Lachnospiraceae bacterium]
MKIIIPMKKDGKVSLEKMAEFAFICYFAFPLIRSAFASVLGSGKIPVMMASLITYIPAVLVCLINPNKYIKKDVVVLFIGVCSFFLITYAMHPEYGIYYMRDEYGVFDHVFSPYRGIYAYFFMRLLNEPKKIVKCLKISGWLMFVSFGYRILQFLRRGYWYGVQGNNVRAEMSYSVSFGYEVLLFALVFMYSALKYKRKRDIAATLICLGMILTCGSRGPILFVGAFIVLYTLVELKNAKHKAKIICATIVVFGLCSLYYNQILMVIAEIITKLGFSSRFLTKLLEGSISTDSGRFRIWTAAIQMIRDRPLGYGAMGARHVISSYIYVGYPHSIILEFLIDYGVFIGGVFLIILAVNSVKIIFGKKNMRWNEAFLPIFCTSLSLLMSLTYWSVPTFWSCLGIGVSRAIEGKRLNRMNIGMESEE